MVYIFASLGIGTAWTAEKLVIYVSLAEEDARQAILAFEEEIGIEVEWVRLEYYWTGIYVNPLCFGSNMNRLKELGLTPPTSWVDLVKPEYQGHIQVANPGTS